MVTITFIRHGQSRDNKTGIWAGWKDAPLSELGVKQARALGQSLSTTHIDLIYTSPLLRALATGQAVQDAQPAPQPPLNIDPNLREQHWGIAEGHPWTLEMPTNKSVEELYEQGIFPKLFGRDEKFPTGESLNDLARRAEQALADCILPHLHQDGRNGNDLHIAITSHGLCISELIAALLRLDPTPHKDRSYTGLLNTAWTRVVVSVQDGHDGPVDPNNPPPLNVVITVVNNTQHFSALKDTVEDVIDDTQAEARSFFGGGGRIVSVTNAGNIAETGSVS